MTVRTLAALALSLLALAPAPAQPENQGPPPARVRFDAARAQQVTIMRAVSGDLVASKRAAVASEEAGRVLTMNVDVGDFVEAGQVLATLDATRAEIDAARLDAEEAARRATVAEREADLRQARRDLERFASARTEGSVAESEIEDAQIAVDVARARLENAAAELDAATADRRFARLVIEDHTIRAPFGGQIVGKQTEVGAWVVAGGPVVELVALDTIDAYVRVPERYLPTLTTPGAKVAADIPALGEQFESGDVTVISSGDELARTFPVRIRYDNPDRRLRPGMSVRALVPTGSYENAVTIHKDAVLRDEGGAFAYFNADGAAAPVRFDVRWRVGDRVVVNSPQIKPGMRFVIEGNERLFPSQPLEDAGEPPQDAPPRSDGRAGAEQNDQEQRQGG